MLTYLASPCTSAKFERNSFATAVNKKKENNKSFENWGKPENDGIGEKKILFLPLSESKSRSFMVGRTSQRDNSVSRKNKVLE